MNEVTKKKKAKKKNSNKTFIVFSINNRSFNHDDSGSLNFLACLPASLGLPLHPGRERYRSPELPSEPGSKDLTFPLGVHPPRPSSASLGKRGLTDRAWRARHGTRSDSSPHAVEVLRLCSPHPLGVLVSHVTTRPTARVPLPHPYPTHSGPGGDDGTSGGVRWSHDRSFGKPMERVVGSDTRPPTPPSPGPRPWREVLKEVYPRHGSLPNKQKGRYLTLRGRLRDPGSRPFPRGPSVQGPRLGRGSGVSVWG